MKQQKPFLAVILFLITGLAACDSTEIGESKDVNQDKIYMDYHIDYTEAEDKVLLHFKYRFAGSAGTTLVLNEPSRVELDGAKLSVDSTETSGAFYEAERKFSQYTGKHAVSFTDINEKKWENNFDLAPFDIDPLPAATDPNKDLIIRYHTELGANDMVEISSMDTDSSFNYQQTGPNNSIIIPAKELLRQKGKTIALSCSVYRETALPQTTTEGGSLKIVYRLKPIKIKLQP